MARKTVALFALLSLLGCGEARESPGPAASAGAPQAGGAGAPQAGSGGMTAGGSGGAVSGSAGMPVAGAGGDPPLGEPTCGGDLSGPWYAERAPDLTAPRPAEINDCWNLSISRSGDSFYADTWYNSDATTRSVRISFEPFAEQLAGNVFLIGEFYFGTVEQTYPAHCLSDGQVTTTCDELGPALTLSGLGSGGYSNVVCAPLDGGCVCDLDVHRVAGGNGTWATSDAPPQLIVTPSYPYDPPEMHATSYCVEGDTLRLGAQIDERYSGWSELIFERVNCTDDAQGPGEDGPDCGLACNSTCD